MDQTTIEAGRLRLRPFTPADIPWVYEVSQDPGLRQYVYLPSPYRLEDAAYFVEHVAHAGSGQRLEYLVEDSRTCQRLGRVGLAIAPGSTAEVGYWVDS